MAAPIKIDLDTELSAVNSILGAIGQAPVTRLADTENRTYSVSGNNLTVPELQFENPEVAFVYQLLMECNLDTQVHGWVFNTEEWYSIAPTTINSQIQYVFPRTSLGGMLLLVRFGGLVMLCVAQILLTVSLNYMTRKPTPLILQEGSQSTSM